MPTDQETPARRRARADVAATQARAREARQEAEAQPIDPDERGPDATDYELCTLLGDGPTACTQRLGHHGPCSYAWAAERCPHRMLSDGTTCTRPAGHDGECHWDLDESRRWPDPDAPPSEAVAGEANWYGISHTSGIVGDQREAPDVFGASVGVMRDAQRVIRELLSSLREERTLLNARIRRLVMEEQYVTRAVRILNEAPADGEAHPRPLIDVLAEEG